MKSESGRNVVAVYWDFENIHASLYDLKNGNDTYKFNRFMSQERLVNIRAVMDYVAGVGDIAINRAYANWNFLNRYRDDFSQVGADLIQLYPRGMNAKNGADIRLALDALEDIYRFQYLTHIIIVGGDSDFISLAQKVKQSNLTIIGIGVQETTNQFWVQCCNEFKYYKTLLGITGGVGSMQSTGLREASPPTKGITPAIKPVATEVEAVGNVVNKANALEIVDEANLGDAKELMLRAVRHLISQRGENRVRKANLKPMMMRMDSAFDEANYGFRTFSLFLDAFSDVIVNVKDDSGGYVQLLDEKTAPTESLVQSSREIYERILKRGNIHILPAPWWRDALIQAEQLFVNTPDNRVPSFEFFEQELGKALEAVGLDNNAALVHKLRGNMFTLWQFRLLNERGLGLKVDPGEGRLLRAVEEEIVRRIIRHAPPPVDTDGVSAILYGEDFGDKALEVEKIVDKVIGFHQTYNQSELER